MLKTELYADQVRRWPQTGQHILAQFDDQSVVVYQAYRPAIGHFAAKHQKFGGEFKLSRMSWIKPNFLWMMYRCGWGQKAEQEVVLAITIRRDAFDLILAHAVHSTYTSEIYGTHDAWKERVLIRQYGCNGIPIMILMEPSRNVVPSNWEWLTTS